MLDGDI